MGSYDQQIIAFINQQKKKLNIPSDLPYKSIIQKFNSNNTEIGWPRYIEIKFENHISEDQLFAYYHMTCLQRDMGLACGKQEVEKIKYQDRWVTNYIKPTMNSDQILEIIKFAELNKPDDWLLPVLKTKSEKNLFTVCFGHSAAENYSPEKYEFELKCLPIKRIKNGNAFNYEAKYSMISVGIRTYD